MNRDYPAQYESRARLKNEKEVSIRPVRETDGPLILDLFNRISRRTIYHRFLARLDTIPQELLYRLTHIDYETEFALTVLVPEKEQDAMIAVARYAHRPQDAATDLAIAVRDDWQNLGLGQALLVKLVAIGKERGISRYVSVMDSENRVIRTTLRKLGYQVSYTFQSGFCRAEINV